MHGKILSNSNIEECYSRKQSSLDTGKLTVYILKFVLKSILDRSLQVKSHISQTFKTKV